jgi:hypothetical protein
LPRQDCTVSTISLSSWPVMCPATYLKCTNRIARQPSSHKMSTSLTIFLNRHAWMVYDHAI